MQEAGEIVFTYRSEDLVPVPVEQVQALGLAPALATAADDLWYSSRLVHWLPLEPPGKLSYAAALNHAENPNLGLRYDLRSGHFQYISRARVRAREELTVDYRVLHHTFGDTIATAQDKYANPTAYFANHTS